MKITKNHKYLNCMVPFFSPSSFFLFCCLSIVFISLSRLPFLNHNLKFTGNQNQQKYDKNFLTPLKFGHFFGSKISSKMHGKIVEFKCELTKSGQMLHLE